MAFPGHAGRCWTLLGWRLVARTSSTGWRSLARTGAPLGWSSHAHHAPPLAAVGDSHGLAGGVEHRRFADQLRRRDSGVEDDLATLLGVGAVETDDDRCPQLDSAKALDDAVGDLLAPCDSAEDVDEDRAHVLVVVDHIERCGHHVGARPAADVEEVGGLAAHLIDDVERAHRQPGAVGDDAHRAVEADVLQILLLGQPLAVVEDLRWPPTPPTPDVGRRRCCRG